MVEYVCCDLLFFLLCIVFGVVVVLIVLCYGDYDIIFDYFVMLCVIVDVYGFDIWCSYVECLMG